MLNPTHHNTNRSASALLVLSLCALLLGAASYADAKSYKPAKKPEGKQAAATVKKTAPQSRKTPTLKPSAGRSMPKTLPGRNSRTPATPVRVSNPTAGPARAPALRPEAKAAKTYRPGNRSTPRPSYRPNARPSPTRRPPVRSAPRPTYRPNPKTTTKYVPPVRTTTQPTYRPNPKTTTKHVPPVRTTPQPSYRPKPKPSTTYRPAPKPRVTKSYRPSGPVVSYKPATRTTYRTRIGAKYHRPSHRYLSSSGSYKYRPYQPPKSYRPPQYRGGHYYYPTHARSKPFYFGFWVFNYCPDFCRRSVYFHFGYFPYIQVTRVYETSYPEVVYVDRPIYVKDSYYLESQRYKALDDALSDVRSAWLSGRYDLIERHVLPNDKVAVFVDGRYDYSVDGEDYLHMTHDALQDIETVSFVWNSVKQRTDGTVTGLGMHRYFDASGNVKDVYVSYTFDKVGGEYYLVEVGSSLDPLY